MTIRNDLIKHQIFLQRLGATQARIIMDQIRLSYQSVADGVKRRIPVEITKATLKMQTKTLVEKAMQHLKDAALYEAEFIAKRLKARGYTDSLMMPAQEVIETAVTKTTMGVKSGAKGKSLNVAHSQFANRKHSEMLQLVTDDVLQQKPEEKTLEALGLLVAGLFVTQARSLGTTAVTFTAATAREEVFKEAEVPRVVWSAILDSSVCPDCEALDGDEWNVGENPIPPEHWNCRCVLVPV